MPSQGDVTAFDDLLFHLRSLSRCIYYVTDEEDRFLVKLRGTLFADRTQVFNAALGLVPLKQLVDDWANRAHVENLEASQIHDALIRIYRDNPRNERNFYVITDPERWLTDPYVVRRVLNIIHQVHNGGLDAVKILIFIGSRKVIPEKLANYMEVLVDRGLSSAETLVAIEKASPSPVPKDAASLFKGLNSYQISMALAQSAKVNKGIGRFDPGSIGEFRRRQLQKVDLVQYIEPDPAAGFAQIGGAQRFKLWAEKTRHAWTPEGRAYGLVPPKGILCVGLWGTGKSLATRALGAVWGLPVVGLEMGRLRSSGVGESEANVYRAIRIIESAAPCLIWVDEAEKSFSGGASSAQSDAGTTSRTIGIFSTWLQETRAPVCLALTANSLKTLPVEFINRADERFFFDMPSADDRIAILRIHLAKNGQSPGAYDLATLSEQSEGMVGREIEQAIRAALRESFVQQKPALDGGILGEELIGKPRLLRTMADEVKEVMAWVGFDVEKNEGVRARFASEPDRANGALKLIVGDDLA